MDLSIEGAREARSIAKAFHAALNSSDVVPEQAYRRNHMCYPLVCYINNITGLYLSKNYEVIPLFIGRAAQHMAEHPATLGALPYYELATQYLGHMAYIVGSFTDIPREELELFVPAEILGLGKQQAPEPSGVPRPSE